MAAASERIVVQATPREKKAIMAKARRLGLPLSELLRRGAAAYEPIETNEELGGLADRAKTASDRAIAAIEDALEFVEVSNKRITALEARAKRNASKAGA
jgi:rhamnose utilization protein RhaD (predicted bifunctional aldolase and dehydrogenase)